MVVVGLGGAALKFVHEVKLPKNTIIQYKIFGKRLGILNQDFTNMANLNISPKIKGNCPKSL